MADEKVEGNLDQAGRENKEGVGDYRPELDTHEPLTAQRQTP